MKDRGGPTLVTAGHGGSQVLVQRCSSSPALGVSTMEDGEFDFPERMLRTADLPASQSPCDTPGRSPSSPHKSKKLRRDKFLERNACASQTQLRRAISLMQRGLHEDMRKSEESCAVNWGNQGAEGFRKWLRSRFGSVPNAWRTVLDPHGHWKLSFGELRLCCQRMGFSGNFKKLWSELDANKSGFVTLGELDAEACEGLADFRQLCFDQYGSTLNAWHQGFNPQGAAHVTEQRFVEHCKAIGYAGDASKLFHWLRTEQSRKVLTLRDFDPRTAAALMRADPLAESLSLGDTSRACSSPAPRAMHLSPLDGRPLSPSGGESPPSAAATLDLRSTGGPPNLSRSRTAPLPARACATRSAGAGAAQAGQGEAATPTAASPGRRRRSWESNEELEATQEGSAPQPLSGEAWQDDLEGTGSGAATLRGGLWASQSLRSASPRSGASTLRIENSPQPTISSEWTRELSVMQITDRVDRQLTEEAANCGLKNPEELKVGLAKRYGSLWAAWSQLLDPVGKGKVPFMEFCEKIRQVGYTGDLKQLWAYLGCVPSGNCVRFRDLDPAFDATLTKFRGKMREKHGNMLNAWKNAFDPGDFGRVEEATFVRQCQRDGFDGDAALLFRTLQGRGRGKLMTLHIFDPAAAHAQVRGDHKMTIAEHERRDVLSMSFEERQTSMLSVKWTAEMSAQSRAHGEMLSAEKRTTDMGCDTAEALKSYLARRYGSLTAAWRCCLDPMNQGRLSFEAFTQAVRQRVGYTGSYPKLWADLVKPDAACILLHDWDPEAAEVLWDFRVWLLQKFGNMIAAWKDGLDPHGHLRLEEAMFRARVQQLGYPGDATHVFDLVKADRERHFITHSDLDCVAAQACWRDDREGWTVGGSKVGARASPREWPGRACGLGGVASAEQLQQQAGVSRHTKVTMWSEKLGHQHRDGIYKADKEGKDRMIGVKNLEGFRQLMSDRFGSSLAGWRSVLDPELNGRLSFGNFRDGLQRLGGWSGSMKQIWSEFDAKGVGQVLFADYDPEVSLVLDEFRDALLQRYPCLHHAWHCGVDPDGFGQLNEATFAENLADMSLAWEPRKVHRLYRLLLPERNSGRKLVMVEDLRLLLLTIPKADRRIVWQGTQSGPPLPFPRRAEPPRQRAETPQQRAEPPQQREESPEAGRATDTGQEVATRATGHEVATRPRSRGPPAAAASKGARQQVAQASASPSSAAAESRRSPSAAAESRRSPSAAAESRQSPSAAAESRQSPRPDSAGSIKSEASTRLPETPNSPNKTPSRRRAKLDAARQEALRQEGREKGGGAAPPAESAPCEPKVPEGSPPALETEASCQEDLRPSSVGSGSERQSRAAEPGRVQAAPGVEPKADPGQAAEPGRAEAAPAGEPKADPGVAAGAPAAAEPGRAEAAPAGEPKADPGLAVEAPAVEPEADLGHAAEPDRADAATEAEPKAAHGQAADAAPEAEPKADPGRALGAPVAEPEADPDQAAGAPAAAPKADSGQAADAPAVAPKADPGLVADEPGRAEAAPAAEAYG